MVVSNEVRKIIIEEYFKENKGVAATRRKMQTAHQIVLSR
jgi:hypothetical protein